VPVNKIMVVEDESIIALDIKSRLKRLGYNIPAVVSSGEEAIKLAGEIRPDLVLMDILLKGSLNGIEAAKIINSEICIPVIFLSSFSDNKTMEEARSASPYGYLIKPFNEIELKKKIDNLAGEY